MTLNNSMSITPMPPKWPRGEGSNMGQFSVEKPVPPGSALSGNQHLLATARQLGVHGPGDRHGYFLAELTSAGVMLLRSPVAPILELPKGARSVAGAFG